MKAKKKKLKIFKEHPYYNVFLIEESEELGMFSILRPSVRIERKFGGAWMGDYHVDQDFDFILSALEKTDVKAVIDGEFEKVILEV